MLVGFVFFFLLIIAKPSLGELILDLMTLVLRAWMEELDVWDLARNAACHLLPAAAVRVNKLSFLNDGMCVHLSGTGHDVHLYTSLLLAFYSSFSFTIISLFIVYLVSLIKYFESFSLGFSCLIFVNRLLE